MTKKTNHYDTLGVPHFASLEDCKTAWRTKTFSQHPDLFKDEADKLVQTEVIKELNRAWFVLGDANRKIDYDNTLRQQQEKEMQTSAPLPEKKKWTIGQILLTGLAIIALIRVGVWVLKFILHLIFGYEPF